jgi:segregation and condensation protein B
MSSPIDEKQENVETNEVVFSSEDTSLQENSEEVFGEDNSEDTESLEAGSEEAFDEDNNEDEDLLKADSAEDNGEDTESLEADSEDDYDEESDFDLASLSSQQEEIEDWDGPIDDLEDEASSDESTREHIHRPIDDMRLESKIEAMIFASAKPMKITDIQEVLGDESVALEDIQEVCDRLVEFYENRCGGFSLQYIKRQGYQFWSAAAAGPLMEKMFASRPRPISRAALETLAIVAYRQPVTRAEVEFIRGVDVGSIFKGLIERDLVKCVGRKEVVGRPMLFGTTDEFLKVFQLQNVKDLPPLESFQPSPEMLQGARDQLDSEDDEVDLERYIAENTFEDTLNSEDTGSQSTEQSQESDANAHEEDRSGASIADWTNEDQSDTEDQGDFAETHSPEMSAGEADQTAVVRIQGATAFDQAEEIEVQPKMKVETDDNDASTEMDIPVGDSFEAGSGELDN